MSLLQFIIDNWEYFAIFGVVVSGIIVFIRNLLLVKNLRLQNKKLAYENSKNETISYKNYESAANEMHELMKQEIDSNRERLKQPGFSEIGRFKDTTIMLSELISSSINTSSLSLEKLLSYFESELRSHPMLTEINYDSLPVPLKDGYFAVITKRQNEIFVENLLASAPNTEINDIWMELTKAYFEAYRLPFRADHYVLRNRQKYKRSYYCISQLYEEVQKFMVNSYFEKHPELYGRLHKLKANITYALQHADLLYSHYLNQEVGDDVLGKIAVSLDMAISSVHKILIEYKPPK